MKKKILSIIIITCLLFSLTACSGNKNPWDNVEVAVDYGEINENENIDLGGWETEMLIDDYVKFSQYNSNSNIYSFYEFATVFNTIGWSTKINPEYEAEEYYVGYVYDLILNDGTYLTIYTDENLQILNITASYCGLNNTGDGELYETMSHLMPIFYAAIPNINKNTINSTYIKVIDMIENNTGTIYTDDIGIYKCTVDYDSSFDTFNMRISNKEALK